MLLFSSHFSMKEGLKQGNNGLVQASDLKFRLVPIWHRKEAVEFYRIFWILLAFSRFFG